MTNSEIAYEIRRIVRGELDDCERALNSEDIARAKSELDDAISKTQTSCKPNWIAGPYESIPLCAIPGTFRMKNTSGDDG